MTSLIWDFFQMVMSLLTCVATFSGQHVFLEEHQLTILSQRWIQGSGGLEGGGSAAGAPPLLPPLLFLSK